MNKLLAASALVFVVLATAPARAHDCCDHCGCHSNCRKVCRVIRETKMVPEVTYSCECEDFCVPGRSVRCGTRCECDRDCECGEHGHDVPNYVPGCATVRTRKKLVKHVVCKPVQSYRWVVEYLCEGCAGDCQANAPGTTETGPPDAARNDPKGHIQQATAVSASSVGASAIKRVLAPVFGP
jgi:hypothetical protein